MGPLADFREILTPRESLSRLTCFGTGGPAEWVSRPRNVPELAQLVGRCRSAGIVHRILGGGSNVLVSDSGVQGVVTLLSDPAFAAVKLSVGQATAGAGAKLTDLITSSCSARMAGLEDLVGIPGTVGGALRGNAGWRTGDIGQHVFAIEMMDDAGEVSTRMRADIRFGYRTSNLDEGIILAATFVLVEDDPDDINRRIKKIWISKKASQPFAFQRAGYVFRNPRGLSAANLLEQAGLIGARIGAAEICDRDAKFIIAHPGATSNDVLRLINLARQKVEERTGVSLELQLEVW